MKPDLGLWLLPRLIHGFVRTLYATLGVRHAHARRIEVLNDSGKHYVLAFWHSQLLLMFFTKHRKPINVMSSLHRDGEISARTQERFGAEVIRGSSSKGGANALRQMVRIAEAGHNLAFTPDGPRGPRAVAQIGVVFAAQATGNPIVPVALIAKKKKTLRSWDRFEVPMPFSRVLFVYGEPIEVARRLTREQMDTARAEVERSLNLLTAEGERDFELLWEEGVR